MPKSELLGFSLAVLLTSLSKFFGHDPTPAPMPEHTFVMDYLSKYSQISGIFHKVLLKWTALSKVLWGGGAGVLFSFPKYEPTRSVLLFK